MLITYHIVYVYLHYLYLNTVKISAAFFFLFQTTVHAAECSKLLCFVYGVSFSWFHAQSGRWSLWCIHITLNRS